MPESRFDEGKFDESSFDEEQSWITRVIIWIVNLLLKFLKQKP